MNVAPVGHAPGARQLPSLGQVCSVAKKVCLGYVFVLVAYHLIWLGLYSIILRLTYNESQKEPELFQATRDKNYTVITNSTCVRQAEFYGNLLEPLNEMFHDSIFSMIHLILNTPTIILNYWFPEFSNTITAHYANSTFTVIDMIRNLPKINNIRDMRLAACRHYTNYTVIKENVNFSDRTQPERQHEQIRQPELTVQERAAQLITDSMSKDAREFVNDSTCGSVVKIYDFLKTRDNFWQSIKTKCTALKGLLGEHEFNSWFLLQQQAHKSIIAKALEHYKECIDELKDTALSSMNQDYRDAGDGTDGFVNYDKYRSDREQIKLDPVNVLKEINDKDPNAHLYGNNMLLNIHIYAANAYKKVEEQEKNNRNLMRTKLKAEQTSKLLDAYNLAPQGQRQRNRRG